ncbi:YktB family protein [Oceanobacillus sp. CAU 1775]
MGFSGFTEHDFNTFLIDGLDARMEAIQNRIQPKFQILGEELTQELSMKLGNEMYLHIARHARRTVNPPNDTWLAICDNKRGYKKHPHFQVGLFDDRLFIWLALIYELPSKQNIAKAFLDSYNDIKDLPDDFAVSLDHMKKDFISLDDLSEKHLNRFRDVKKAELLVGRVLNFDDPIVQDGDKLLKTIKDTYQDLIPFYQLAMRSR